MIFTVITDLGPIRHETVGLQAMRSRIWEIAKGGTTIIIEEEREYAVDPTPANAAGDD